MRNILVLAAFASLAIPMSAEAQPSPTAARSTSGAVVKVNGLVCDFCVQALNRTFRREAAIKDFAVDLDKREIRMSFHAGRSLDDARIRTLVTNAGYQVVGIVRS